MEVPESPPKGYQSATAADLIEGDLIWYRSLQGRFRMGQVVEVEPLRNPALIVISIAWTGDETEPRAVPFGADLPVHRKPGLLPIREEEWTIEHAPLPVKAALWAASVATALLALWFAFSLIIWPFGVLFGPHPASAYTAPLVDAGTYTAAAALVVVLISYLYERAVVRTKHERAVRIALMQLVFPVLAIWAIFVAT